MARILRLVVVLACGLLGTLLLPTAHAAPTTVVTTPGRAWRLLTLAAPLVPTRLTPGVVSPLVGTLLTAGALEDATDDELALALVWAAHESAGQVGALSADGLDCGLVQLRGPALQGHTCAAVRADGVLAVQLWLRWLRVVRTACGGSEARVLGGLATGRCGGAPQLVRLRCARAGVDCAALKRGVDFDE